MLGLFIAINTLFVCHETVIQISENTLVESNDIHICILRNAPFES